MNKHIKDRGTKKMDFFNVARACRAIKAGIC